MSWDRVSRGRVWNQVVAGAAIVVAVLSSVAFSAVHAQAQTLVRDTTASMGNVTDVTGGMQYLLQNDDLAMLQVRVGQNLDNGLYPSIVTMQTSSGAVSGNPQTTSLNNSFQNYFSISGNVAAEAAGRMYDTRSDTIAVLNAVSPQPYGWFVTLLDPLTGVRTNVNLSNYDSRVPVSGTVFTQVVMGDFTGDALADPLFFYESQNGSSVKWALRAFSAVDPNNEQALPKIGPEFFSSNGPAPISTAIVAGDFNGDGREEIAALADDNQTILFFSVDPNTLAITQTSTVKLPVNMVTGQATLAAGRFRNHSPATTNADVVVFGQIYNAPYGYSVIPIKITPNQDGTISAQVQQANSSGNAQFFRFNNKHGSYGALAQGAPILYVPQQTFQQLVLGIKTNDGAGYIEIGSFAQDDTLSNFQWESETKLEYGAQTLLQSMQVGNFDTFDANNQPASQLETFEWDNSGHDPYVRVFDINAPPPPPTNPLKPGNWLRQRSEFTSSAFARFGEQAIQIVIPGDFQGRSLRLGSPTIVRIPTSIQPDLVLAIPPMHVDWIAPYYPDLAQQESGCTAANVPCVVNLSVLPNQPPSVQSAGFATSFALNNTSKVTSKAVSTTAWGVSVKETASTSVSFNDGFSNSSVSITNTAKYAHDNSVKNEYDKYVGKSVSLSATTGFADHVFYTSRGMNVYYYPVLGCDSDGASCTVDGTKAPVYVQFSVPDQITHSDTDGTTQDWYQPVHEPGNVLSYPWTLSQLKGEFSDTVIPLTSSSGCKATDTSTQSFTTQWTSVSSQTKSSGSTNSFSDELSMSYSAGAGLENVDGASFSSSLDIGGSTSLGTLNVSESSLTSSEGVTVTKPTFGYGSVCCTYAFGGYIFGLQNTNYPSTSPACGSANASDKDCTIVNDGSGANNGTGSPVDLPTTGPLFTGFLADPISGTDHELPCAGNAFWWQKVYTKPDIALNHPGRWYWDRARLKAVFNAPDPQANPVGQSFYQMKNFYITRQGKPAGPSLGAVDPGTPLTLTVRVFNYSLASTTAPVHVRFYGQIYCMSPSGSPGSPCTTGPTCNPPGVCGNSFPIGSDQIIAAIPGFEAETTAPNWALASVDFTNTSQYTNSYMVFWVIAWMENGGVLGEEMAGHGLTSIPGNLTQITNAPIEAYSNNVGMYPTHQPFYICPTVGCVPENSGPGAVQSGVLQHISLSASPQIALEQPSKLALSLQTAGGPLDQINVAYFDGNPTKGGTLLDYQKITHIDSGATAYHTSSFTPETCGVHTLFASVWQANDPETVASASTNVTLDATAFIQAVITSTQSTVFTDRTTQSTLLSLLTAAAQSYQSGQAQAAESILSVYVQTVSAASGTALAASDASKLIGQAGVLLGCGSNGFLLSALPNTATVNSGSNATFALGVTPSGGFTGTVKLSCVGAPAGASCSISSQSVVLDGVNQSQLTVTVSTDSGAAMAGVVGGWPVSMRSITMRYILMILASLFAMVLLRKARLRSSFIGCILVLIVLGGAVGCGSNAPASMTPAGTYTLVVQGTSGSAVQNATLVLTVK